MMLKLGECSKCSREKYIVNRKYMMCQLCNTERLQSQNATSKKRIAKRTPIKRVSDKQQKKNKAYSVLRAQFLKDFDSCKKCGRPATDIHHAYHRVGKAMLDTSTWISMCRECHDWVHKNPKEAIKRGYLASVEQKNNYYKENKL